jgi:hypothetical protein
MRMKKTKKNVEPPSYTINITFIDNTKGNEPFVRLGGAAWTTRKTQMTHWDALPSAPIRTMFMAELLDAHQCIEAEKYITTEIVEDLIGKPIGSLVECARAETRLRYAPLRAKVNKPAAL